MPSASGPASFSCRRTSIAKRGVAFDLNLKHRALCARSSSPNCESDHVRQTRLSSGRPKMLIPVGGLGRGPFSHQRQHMRSQRFERPAIPSISVRRCVDDGRSRFSAATATRSNQTGKGGRHEPFPLDAQTLPYSSPSYICSKSSSRFSVVMTLGFSPGSS